MATTEKINLQMSEKKMDVLHLAEANLSIGVSVNKDTRVATIAVAACGPKDHFSRRVANLVLERRINNDPLLNVLKGDQRALRFEVFYDGHTPRKDILYPIADAIRDKLNYVFNEKRKKFDPPVADGRSVNRNVKTMLHLVKRVLKTKRFKTLTS